MLDEIIIAVLFFAMDDAKDSERRLLQAPVWTGAWRSALFAADMEAIVDICVYRDVWMAA